MKLQGNADRSQACRGEPPALVYRRQPGHAATRTAPTIARRWTLHGLRLAAVVAVVFAAIWVPAATASAQTSPDIQITADDHTPANGSAVEVSIGLIDADLNPTTTDEDIVISFTLHGEINQDYLPSRFEFEVDGAAPPSLRGGEYSVVVPAGATSVEFTLKVTVSDIGEADTVEAIIGAWHDPDPSETGGLTPLGQGVLVVVPDTTTPDPPPKPPADLEDTTTPDPPPSPPAKPEDTTPTNPGGNDDHRVDYTGARQGGIGRNLPDVWAERLLPERRFFAVDAETGRWLRSSPVALARWDGGDAPFPEASVRVAARRHAGGRVEFGLEQRQPDGTWNRRSLPSRRIVPADAEVDRWLAGSSQTVQIAATDVRMRITARRLADGRTEFALQQSLARPWIKGRAEIRIAARQLDDGRTQFAFQQRHTGGTWSGRSLPGRRFVPADAAVDRWRAGSPVLLRIAETADAAAADVVARISAQPLSDGSIAFAVEQYGRDGTWSEPLLPTWTFAPSAGSTDWLPSPPVAGDAGQSIEDTDQPAQTP